MKNLVQYLLVIVALSLSSVATGETEVVVGVAADGGYVTKPIAEIEVGDTVLTRDENNPDGPMVQTQVADKLSYQVDHLREITVQSADGTSETIRTTDFHPFFVEGLGWVGAVYLQPGQMLQGPNGEALTVVETAYEPLAQPVMVYNLSLAQDHTYFVAEGDGIAGAADAVWVHNAGCPVASSRTLGRNLEKSGIIRPADSAAHHIVAGEEELAAEARDIIKRAGIDINDAANGVFLPREVSVARPPTFTHTTLHTDLYYEVVTEELRWAERNGKVRETLINIGQSILGGRFIY